MATNNIEIYNAEEMLIQCLNDKNLFNQFLKMAIETLPSYQMELLNAIESQNNEMVSQKAHKLKSFTGNIKLNQLNTILIELEREANANNTSFINSKLDELNQAFALAKQALQNEFSNI